MVPPRIHALRLTFERLYPAHARSPGHPGPPLHALLAVPLPERLILLALIDHAPAEEIRRTLKATSEDLALTSDRMRTAVRQLKEALLHPYAHLDPLHEPERQLQRLLFPSAAVLLFGEGVPAALAYLTLRQKAVLYLLLVESWQWQAIQEFLGCSEWTIRQAVRQAKEQIGAR
jgi:hypothetical protein